MRRFRVVACATLVGMARLGAAQPPPVPAGSADLEAAKDLFRRGNELRRAGDCGAAVVLYLQSRALVASAANTMNTAFCLHQLEREDEALDLYEELVSRFPDALTDADRALIAPAMAELRRGLGWVEIAANVEGAVVIDGRARGRLPLLAPIRLRPGPHQVRVIKDGWHTFEQTVEIGAGRASVIDARLDPLTVAGRLRVECPESIGAEVLVDGARLGTCPVELALDPGSHLWWTRLGARGSDPSRAEVVFGQTTVVIAPALPMGPELRIITDPTTASLWIDGVDMGASPFHGALSLGPHRLEAREAGYLPATVVLDGSEGGPKVLELAPDRAHPRWVEPARAAPGFFSLTAETGLSLLATVGGAGAAACGDGCSAAVPVGARGLARGAWTSRGGLGVGIDVGYQFAQIAYEGRAGSLYPVGRPELENTGSFDERLRWSSFLAGAALFYRARGAWPWQVTVAGGISVGRVFAFRDGAFVNSTGTRFSAAQESASNATYAYLSPEVRVGRALGGGLELSVGVALLAHLGVSEPVWENTDIVPTSTTAADRGDGGATFAGERLLGQALVGGLSSLALTWEIP